MKLLFSALLLFLVLLLALAGCDSTGVPTPTTLAPTSVAPTSAAPTTAPNDQDYPTSTPYPTSTAYAIDTPPPAPSNTPVAATATVAVEPTATLTSTATPVAAVVPTEPIARSVVATREPAMPKPTEEAGPPPTVTTVVSEEPPAAGWSQVVKMPPGHRRVAITFDAGASGEPMPQILAALRQRGLHITMFFTGKFAEQYPEGVKQAAADGHELANHTYSHLDSRELTDDQLREELARTEKIITDLTGRSTKPYWRPPYGAYNAHVLNVAAEQGYRSIYWTLDSLDSVGQPKTPDFLYNRVTNPPGGMNLDGAIVLMHFGSQASADALPRILDRLAEMGLQVVTISELISP